MSNFHHQPGDFFRTVMTVMQYCVITVLKKSPGW